MHNKLTETWSKTVTKPTTLSMNTSGQYAMEISYYAIKVLGKRRKREQPEITVGEGSVVKF